MREIRSLRERRRLVVVCYLGLGVLTASLLFSYFYSGDIHPALGLLWLFVSIAGPLFSIYAFACLWSSIQGLSSTKEEELDERQLTVLKDAYYKAYWSLFSVVLALGFFLILLPNQLLNFDVPWVTLRGIEDFLGLLQTLFWLILVFMVTLPYMTIVWNEPSPGSE